MQLLDSLPRGRANAITRRELLERTGLSDRALRRELHDLRVAGELICSITPPGGFFRPADETEINGFVVSMTNRARSTFAAASAARRALKDVPAGGEQNDH